MSDEDLIKSGGYPPGYDPSEVGRFYAWVVDLCIRHHGSIVSGCRTLVHNVSVGGVESSKHTFVGGWGMACDLKFDVPLRRDAAAAEVATHPLYHRHIGDSYLPTQLHVQGWKYGEKPHRRKHTMTKAPRKPASKKEEVGVIAAIVALASVVGGWAESKMPGTGQPVQEIVTAAIAGLGAAVASWVRDKLAE